MIIVTIASDRQLVIHAMGLGPTFCALLPKETSGVTTPPSLVSFPCAWTRAFVPPVDSERVPPDPIAGQLF